MIRPTLSIYQNALLVLDHAQDYIEPLQKLVPDVKKLTDGRLAMRWTWFNAACARLIGLPAVSPIYKEYDWPRPPDWNVLAHQKHIANFAVLNRKSYVFAGTGSGKTASLMWATDYLMRQKVIKKVLVVCPLSVMADAWLPTVNRCLLGRRSIIELYGSKKKRQELLKQNADYYVINYDGNPVLQEELLSANFDAVIIDESTAIKNATTDRFASLYPIVKKAQFAWCLTGTPVPQGPMDAHGQIAILDKFKYKLSRSQWENMVTIQVSQFKRIPKKGWEQIVYKYMRPAYRVDTRDVVDLPPITYSRRRIEFTKAQAAALRTLKAHNKVILDDTEVTAANAAVVVNKFCQICAGAVYNSDGDVVNIQPTARLQETKELIMQSEGKVLVFAPFKPVVELIANFLRKEGIKCAVVTGDLPKKQRQKIFDKIQNASKDELQVLVAIPDAMSHGVTLTQADHVIWYAPVRKSEVYLQAIARMERMGQKRHMHVTQLYGHPYEAELYEVLADRDNGQKRLIGLYKKLTS